MSARIPYDLKYGFTEEEWWNLSSSLRRHYRMKGSGKTNWSKLAGERKIRTQQLLRKNMLFRKYGITPEQYNEMLLKQDGKCAICRSVDSKSARTTNMAVDHDHTTSKVRGLLCNDCNIAIGLLQDNPLVCEAAAEYLKLYLVA